MTTPDWPGQHGEIGDTPIYDELVTELGAASTEGGLDSEGTRPASETTTGGA